MILALIVEGRRLRLHLMLAIQCGVQQGHDHYKESNY